MLIKRRINSPAMLLAGGLAVILAGCDGGGALGVDEGRVRFVLSAGADVTPGAAAEIGPASGALQDGVLADHDDERGDRPRQFFQSANITLSSVLARNLSGQLVDVEMDLPATVDVVMLDEGKEVTLPDGILPPASYDQVVIVMTNLEGVTLDGTTISITPPGGGWTAIVPICPFTVAEGGTATVGITFMLNRAFSWRNGRYSFQPRIVCDEDDSA